MNKKDNLKRVIVDFKKLTPEILALLVEKYPDGYDEVKTNDTKYLVKVSTKLAVTMENYDEDDYEDFAEDDPEAVQDPEIEVEDEVDEEDDDKD